MPGEIGTVGFACLVASSCAFNCAGVSSCPGLELTGPVGPCGTINPVEEESSPHFIDGPWRESRIALITASLTPKDFKFLDSCASVMKLVCEHLILWTIAESLQPRLERSMTSAFVSTSLLDVPWNRLLALDQRDEHAIKKQQH